MRPCVRALCANMFCIALIANALAVQAEEAEPPEHDQETAAVPLDATRDDERRGLFQRFTGQAVLLCINARIMERDRVVSWNESHRKVTIPGHPVEIKLVGTNVVVAVQFTPYMRRGGTRKFLVAQGQIWMETPGRGIRYHASMQTIPVRFGEPIYFFPLGPVRDDTPSIEVILTVYPHEDEE
ncbi:MAG: hypothetical protein FWB79_07245 [Treponema sp.]|nr:hypothetical protein [Treponema sp.]